MVYFEKVYGGNLVLAECGKLCIFLSSGKNNSSGHKYQKACSFGPLVHKSRGREQKKNVTKVVERKVTQAWHEQEHSPRIGSRCSGGRGQMWCVPGWRGHSLGRGIVLSRVLLLARVVNERDKDGAIAQVVYPLPVFFRKAFLAKELVYRLDVLFV